MILHGALIQGVPASGITAAPPATTFPTDWSPPAPSAAPAPAPPPTAPPPAAHPPYAPPAPNKAACAPPSTALVVDPGPMPDPSQI